MCWTLQEAKDCEEEKSQKGNVERVNRQLRIPRAQRRLKKGSELLKKMGVAGHLPREVGKTKMWGRRDMALSKQHRDKWKVKLPWGPFFADVWGRKKKEVNSRCGKEIVHSLKS